MSADYRLLYSLDEIKDKINSLDSGFKIDIGKNLTSSFKGMKDELGAHFLLSFIFCVLVSFSLGILAGPLMAGWYIFIYRNEKREESGVGNLFAGFRHTLGFWIYEFLTTVPSIAFLFYMIHLEETGVLPNEAGALFGMLFIPIYFFSSALLMFTPFFILFARANVFQAMGLSVKLFFKSPMWCGLMYLVIFVIGWAGSSFCYIGMIFTLPIATMMNYRAFRDIFSEEERDKTEEILEHLI